MRQYRYGRENKEQKRPFTNQDDFLSGRELEVGVDESSSRISVIKIPQLMQANEFSELRGRVITLGFLKVTVRSVTGREHTIRFRGEHQPILASASSHAVEIVVGVKNSQAESVVINMSLDDERINKCVRLAEVAK